MPLFNKGKGKQTGSTNSNGDNMEIGKPYMVQHNFHVGFDKVTGDFSGLPPAWEMLLKNSNIT